MQRVNVNDLDNFTFKTRRKIISAAEPIYRELDSLTVGQGLHITKAEWPLKNRPIASCLPRRIRKLGRKYTVRTLADESGFVISRTA